MKKACVTGWPIDHSRSPIIHGYWLDKYGIDGSYGKVAVAPEEAEAFYRGLAASGFVGCNVTVPHKEVAYRCADQRDASAVAVAAANTLWVEDGRICASNTDTYGFMTHLNTSAPGWQRNDGGVLVLGAGGAARAIVHGFVEAGCDRVVITNRTASRADTLAQMFGDQVSAAAWDKRSDLANECNVIVNTTTLGMKGEGTLDIEWRENDQRRVVCDIVYVPLETEFLAGARKAVHTIVDGLGMLLHQAVPGFERWFGVRPEVTEELRQILLADLGQT